MEQNILSKPNATFPTFTAFDAHSLFFFSKGSAKKEKEKCEYDLTKGS